MKFEIRKIIYEDNQRVKEVLVSVMKEFDVPENGTACLLYTSDAADE